MQPFISWIIFSFILHGVPSALSHRLNGHGLHPGRLNDLQIRAADAPPARHGTLTFERIANVTRVTVDNPPINLLDANLVSDLHDFLEWTQPGLSKESPAVVIFASANPTFFIGHYDLNELQTPSTLAKTAVFNQFVECGRLLQSVTSTIFIAEVNGITVGGGSELNSQMDMRFAGPSARVSQYENSMGFVAAAGGQLFLPTMVGKSKALEYLLASKLFDCSTGATLGLFNDCYRDNNTLTSSVNALAARIGLFPRPALNDTKFSPNYLNPTTQMLDDQITRFDPIAALPSSQEVIVEYLTASKNQTAGPFEEGVPNTVLNTFYKAEMADNPLQQSILHAAD